MTKEELEKEAEKYIAEHSEYSEVFEETFVAIDTLTAMVDFAEQETKELKAQIEKMKCCGNCENGELSAHEEPCRHCQRCFASKDVTDQENVKDNWEAIKEIKENE